MRRDRIAVGIVLITLVAGLAYRHLGWTQFLQRDTRLMANLSRPDALIRTSNLARLPRDLLRVPIAKEVLTSDLAFYYEQHEDRLGFSGSIKRIAYEHKLDWTDRLLALALDEPAEVIFWRDGKGALRHYAIVMRRNALSKIMQEAVTVALKDSQLSTAGEIQVGGSTVPVYALQLHPRRTLLVVSSGERIVVLSDPGLLLDQGSKVVPAAQTAVAAWLSDTGAIAREFELDPIAGGTQESIKGSDASRENQARHSLAISARALALGYAPFVPGFKGLRFDFGGASAGWTTHVWIDSRGLPPMGLGDAELWRAAPANPSACVLLPVDWRATAKVVTEARNKPPLADHQPLAALDGSALACWYSSSTLYAPVFIARLGERLPDRDAVLQALAEWAIKPAQASTGGENTALVLSEPPAAPAKDEQPASKATLRAIPGNATGDAMIWRAAGESRGPTVAAQGAFVVFSPDAALVDLTLDTLAKKHPSAADQMPGTGATLAVFTPRTLSEMAGKEMLAALSHPGEANLHAAAQTLLPPRLQALAKFPPYRLVLPLAGKAQSGWHRVEWRSPEERQ